MVATPQERHQPIDIDAAVVQLGKAKALADEAEAFRLAARDFLLGYFKAHPTAFRPDPKGKQTVMISRGGVTASITLPMSSEVPAHFDQSKADKFRDHLQYEIGEDKTADYFAVVYTFREERYWQDFKTPEGKERIAPYMIAKKDSSPLAPRVAAS